VKVDGSSRRRTCDAARLRWYALQRAIRFSRLIFEGRFRVLPAFEGHMASKGAAHEAHGEPHEALSEGETPPAPPATSAASAAGQAARPVVLSLRNGDLG
jgi:hypothetical protein